MQKKIKFMVLLGVLVIWWIASGFVNKLFLPSPPQVLFFTNKAGEKNKVYANNLKIKKSGEIYDRMGSEYTFFKLEEKEKMKAFVEQKTRRLKEKRKKLQLFLILNKRF